MAETAEAAPTKKKLEVKKVEKEEDEAIPKALREELDLSKEQARMLKQTFDSFDLEKTGNINNDMIAQILDMLGIQQSADELNAIIKEIDEDGNGVMSFEEFAHLASRFLVDEEEDTEAILRELKEAFRLYDKEGLGYISVDLLKDILKELDDKMTPQDLNELIDEIDVDKSGTVDWEEFKAMMIG